MKNKIQSIGLTKLKKSDPAYGRKLLAEAMNYVLENPRQWDQRKSWRSGRRPQCLLSWAGYFARGVQEHRNLSLGFSNLLGMTYKEARYLFQAKRTLSELYVAVELFVNYGAFLGEIFVEEQLPPIRVPTNLK